ncbi:hypothetical protein NP493_26g07048 [Ridgeia piscesae]|uniref:N-acetylgalactosaminide beta-1,3-galactosyltransferase n=1 Tax=Ridgeia piscesae TaxID=27915 RepID=A0AAD9PDA6_RIDPI|nr:hypothetical protein NP493_26g07048 [Ridgeia piscesae]
MTSPATLETRARHVRDTWGKRCDVLLFASDCKNDRFPTINITVPHGRDHLAMKTSKTFDYVYTHHRDQADWFLKADDDTYVIMENLRHMLTPYNPQEALSFGHAFITTAQFFRWVHSVIETIKHINPLT